MTSEDFKVIDFPTSRLGVVYVVLYIVDGREVPFYVGETERFQGRMDDYLWADFRAATDFKIGEAIKYLRNVKNFRVVVRYKESANRKNEEKQLIEKLRAEGFRLLNDFPGYSYQSADKNCKEKRSTNSVTISLCPLFKRQGKAEAGTAVVVI